MEIAELAAKDHEGVDSIEIIGNRSRGRGAGQGTVVNGDKYFFSVQATTTMKEGTPPVIEGAWSFTGGTGKLKGIKGKGTYKGQAKPDGNATFEVEGEYLLPK